MEVLLSHNAYFLEATMEVAEPNLSFFVKVDCKAHSNHRNPQGVYQVTVVEEESVLHSACAALELVRERAAFVSENEGNTILRVFSSDGQEIAIPKTVDTKFFMFGVFEGRANEHPENISLQ